MKIETTFGGIAVTVDYDIVRGQKAITNRAPEDCQEGFPDMVTINSVTTTGDISEIMRDTQLVALAEKIEKQLRAA